ncbi:hypothetical protein C8246_00785 [Paracidovorax avenae]|nr:hypothetical protein C8246_00785 [Paracidovorax avenae]AVS99340.1 hypothetical protein C8236_11260 [Paracidovorax avenae]
MLLSLEYLGVALARLLVQEKYGNFLQVLWMRVMGIFIVGLSLFIMRILKRYIGKNMKLWFGLQMM